MYSVRMNRESKLQKIFTLVGLRFITQTRRAYRDNCTHQLNATLGQSALWLHVYMASIQ